MEFPAGILRSAGGAAWIREPGTKARAAGYDGNWDHHECGARDARGVRGLGVYVYDDGVVDVDLDCEWDGRDGDADGAGGGGQRGQGRVACGVVWCWGCCSLGVMSWLSTVLFVGGKRGRGRGVMRRENRELTISYILWFIGSNGIR